MSSHRAVSNLPNLGRNVLCSSDMAGFLFVAMMKGQGRYLECPRVVYCFQSDEPSNKLWQSGKGVARILPSSLTGTRHCFLPRYIKGGHSPVSLSSPPPHFPHPPLGKSTPLLPHPSPHAHHLPRRPSTGCARSHAPTGRSVLLLLFVDSP